ncbi:MAG: toxin-antitoxin system HicB family antitoxin [Pseudomonadota bacterium]
MNRDLEFYMNLPYTIELVPIPESEGGGFTAQLPEVGRLSIVADGETPEEALSSLDHIKRERFSHYIEKGLSIPLPAETLDEFSGRFVLRVPKELHRKLVDGAKKNGASLNQYVNYLLTSNIQSDHHMNEVNRIVGKLERMCETFRETTYHFSLDMQNAKVATEPPYYITKGFSLPKAA